MKLLLIAALLAPMQSAPQPRPKVGTILWTFDDGPHRRSAPRILDLLDKYRLKSTWFVLGSQLWHPRHRAILKDIVRRGHTLANHLWSHTNPCKLGARRVVREWKRCDKRIRAVVGSKALLPWYRPPFGARCHWRSIRKLGQRVVMWNTADIGTSARTIWRRIKYRITRGKQAITLWHHDWRKLRKVLKLAEKDGYIQSCSSVDAKATPVLP
jgi:peptidoglycan/xylan/chitin deacetylase (PgdA/CDA1 family)